MPAEKTALHVFVSYAAEDEGMQKKLIEHLSLFKRQGLISLAPAHSLNVSQEQAQADLDASDIILLLVSSAYIASDYCYEIEMPRALERHTAGVARVIPILLSPCDWQETPFGRLFALPRHFQPITEWSSREAAYADIAKNIKAVITELRRLPAATTTTNAPFSELGPSPLGIYIVYTWADERMEQEIEAHLQMLPRRAPLAIWRSDMISPGKEWQSEIDSYLQNAHLILLLVSQNAMQDELLFQLEMQAAMRRYEAGAARVIPIILSPCNWQQAPFAKLLVLPRGGTSVVEWAIPEAVIANIVKNINVVVEELRAQRLLKAQALLTFDSASQIPQAEKEKALKAIEQQLETTFEARVTSAVKRAMQINSENKRNTAIATIALTCLLILLFELTIHSWLPFPWLTDSLYGDSIQTLVDIIIVLFISGLMYVRARVWCWVAGIVFLVLLVMQIVAGFAASGYQ